ncbi:MAG: hypothetical protein HW376_1571, partial [candidate division NC10 bacterium]|nr:hypothetical protein [candidate division NC10 bacterium]
RIDGPPYGLEIRGAPLEPPRPSKASIALKPTLG